MQLYKRRYLYIIFLSICRLILIKYFTEIDYLGGNIVYDFFSQLLIITLLWEGIFFKDRYLDAKIRLITDNTKRIGIQFFNGASISLIITFLFAVLVNFYFYQLPYDAAVEYILFSTLLTFLGFLIVFIIEMADRFFIQLKSSILETENSKIESLRMQLKNLEDQINPHFLFNNLSVLSSLVYSNQDKAVDFIHQLSKVYRYLLDHRNYELVTLEKELDFINSYCHLLKIRFNEKLKFDINVSLECQRLKIPPMTLQLLIENAIKHNEISSTKNLKINITAKLGEVKIENNVQPRHSNEPSSKTGLKNIIGRYSYYTEKKVLVENNAQSFNVKIPLLT